MEDTEMTEATVVDAVKTELKKLMKPAKYSSFVDSMFEIEVDPLLTDELQTLKNSEAEELEGEGTLFACDIKNEDVVDNFFLELANTGHTLYIREGYDELYEDIKVLWGNKLSRNVILIGNAGSGKSWYQLYVIRRLLRHEQYSKDGDDYDFIFRQAGKQMYLIDIKECRGYVVKQLDGRYMKCLTRCLYFFEPGNEKELHPLNYGIPALLTLSPFEERIKEIRKQQSTTLYFWPWSFMELKMMIDHESKGNESFSIGFDKFCENFKYFGGIVRHHLAAKHTQKQQKNEIVKRINNVDLDILQKKTVNIDRSKGNNNISGYILCYDGKREALAARRFDEGKNTQEIYFDESILRYTSEFVEEEVTRIIDKRDIDEKMGIVLDRLECHRDLDFSGKNLEAVATEFLKDGKVDWEMTKAGSGIWNSFKTRQRKVTKQYDISTLLTKPSQLLVPRNPIFPVADMVFSGWHSNNDSPVDVFQCTWRPTHPFTIRALYMLRVKYLLIEDHKKLRVFMFVPGHEESYSKMAQMSFLNGSIDEPLKYTNSLTVKAESLQAMWKSTDVYILRPKQGWKKLVGDYLVPAPDIQSQQTVASSKRDAANIEDGEQGQKPAAKKSKTNDDNL